MSQFSKNLFQNLRNKYRLVVMNDETFEEKISFRLSRMNVYVVLSTILLTMVLFTLALVFFTPLKEYIPGYADVTLRLELEDQKVLVDL